MGKLVSTPPLTRSRSKELPWDPFISHRVLLAKDLHLHLAWGFGSPGNMSMGRTNVAGGQKSGRPKMGRPGKWKHGLKPAVPWWFNFDPTKT